MAAFAEPFFAAPWTIENAPPVNNPAATEPPRTEAA